MVSDSLSCLHSSSAGTCLGDDLHVTVLNTIVHHLYVMASTVVTNPVAARLTVTLGCDALENVFDVWPCLLIPSRHQTWSISGTLFTTGYTGSDESNALLFQVVASPVRVRKVGVSAVNDDVTRFAVWKELLNEVV